VGRARERERARENKMAERGGGRRKERGPGQFSRKVAERVAVKDQGIGPLLTRRCLLQEEMYKNQMCCEVLLMDRRGLCGCVALAEIITEAIEIVAASARGVRRRSRRSVLTGGLHRVCMPESPKKSDDARGGRC